MFCVRAFRNIPIISLVQLDMCVHYAAGVYRNTKAAGKYEKRGEKVVLLMHYLLNRLRPVNQ